MNAGTIRTARLRLRPPCEADVPRVAEALDDWTVAGWLSRTPYPYTEADARQFLLAPQPGSRERWAVADGASDRLLGLVTLEPCAEGREAGYWLHPDAQGHGFMAEALAGLLALADTAEPGLIVVATIHPDNYPSRRVLERCGFRFVEERPIDRPRRRGTGQVHLYRRNSG
ncbi:RimJ/RimL family protein N-acetyltransferase [Stella humosa]|uniref:RimJ/RimL family protein N-acetyltransferase n=1 Tax=Stella humosa TaxID=94 RepID=A0A3N1M9R3_9PROT|nr:GNAT family N-acetyltransferase [Stella humosa]ROP99784.1 RimJ/RimL family protein N-acetyltransferase [Stella humosa]BBK30989.1 N-acetyltransferase [Stella humosa]